MQRLCYGLLLAALLISNLAFAQSTAVATQFEHGTLSKGQPAGVWEYFDEAGRLELRMNYDSSRINYRRPDTARYELRVGDSWQLARPNRAPGPLGSRAGRRDFMRKHLKYPVSALQQRLQGDVLVSYVVQPDGHTTDYTVVKSLSPACDQAVYQALSELPDRWVAAIFQGQARAARFYVLAHFEMMEAASVAEGRTAAAYLEQQCAALSPLPYTDRVFISALGVARVAAGH